MPHEASVQPEASIVSTGLGNRYVQNYTYAYSGIQSIDNTETSQLEFTSGSGVIVATILFNNLSDDKKFTHRVYMNDIVVQAYTSFISGGRRSTDIQIVIPPLTRVKLTSQNITDSASKDQIVGLTGRVYGAE